MRSSLLSGASCGTPWTACLLHDKQMVCLYVRSVNGGLYPLRDGTQPLSLMNSSSLASSCVPVTSFSQSVMPSLIVSRTILPAMICSSLGLSIFFEYLFSPHVGEYTALVRDLNPLLLKQEWFDPIHNLFLADL